MTAVRQLAALLALRWQLVRTPGVKLLGVVGVLGLGWLLVLTLGAPAHVDPAALVAAVDLAPQAFLGFAVLAVVAPLTAGGGSDLVPASQLVAYPVRPATLYLGGLVLAPVNLVWVVQLVALAFLSAVLSVGGSTALALGTVAAYVLATTVLGQTVAWTVVGLRQTRDGRRLVLAAAAAAVLGAAAVLRLGAGAAVLAAAPTRQVVRGVVAGGTRELGLWVAVTAALLMLAVAGLVVGVLACAWATSRPGDLHQRADRAVRRRSDHASPLRALIAQDRASVWRAPALRRGGLVLLVLPGVAAAGAQVTWASLVVLPGLVSAGAALLFGINAFCLDGAGAVWLASLPHPPGLLARAKLVVIAETVLAAVAVTIATGSLRSPGGPTAAQLSAIAASGLACSAVVVAGCLALSLRRPHRADLAGPRDAVLPPGALLLASVRCAVPAALVGAVEGAAATLGEPLLPPLLALPALVWAALSLRRSLRRWDDPAVRARVVQAVSAG